MATLASFGQFPSFWHLHWLLPAFLLLLLEPVCSALHPMERQGCGETKGCLFKPAGCNPMLDCSIAIIFYVSSRNQLTVQMTAQSLVPAPSLQYVAIGFSHDMYMGDDFVTECVLSPDGSMFSDVEVFASYNLDRTSNDRSWLNASERSLLYNSVEGEMNDGRLYCSFVKTIRPQFSLSNGPAGRIWDLDKKFWIMGATGSAQPDEINAHDTAIGSHFYPIVSSRAIDPSRIGVRYFDLPPSYVATTMRMPTMGHEGEDGKEKERGNDSKGPSSAHSHGNGAAALRAFSVVALLLPAALISFWPIRS